MSDTHNDWDPSACRREIARLRVALVVMASIWAATAAWLAMRTPPVPPVLAVERLDIVEPDGTPAFVLANSQRPVPATIEGQVILADQDAERRGVPSFIFFDGKGDEVGGMTMGVRETDDGYSAVRHLSLDGYRQDQTVVLSHTQSPNGSRAGLSVSDRPRDVSILEAFAELGLEPGTTRAQMTAAIQAIPEAERADRLRPLFGAQRLFLGSTTGREAALVLNDGHGRPRIVLQVTEAGEPSLRFLDENGEVVAALPE